MYRFNHRNTRRELKAFNFNLNTTHVSVQYSANEE